MACPSSARGWIHGAGNDGLIKLVEDADRGVLVGATSAGPSGGEVLGALAVAVHAAVPTEHLTQMIFAYPTSTAPSKTRSATFSEANGESTPPGPDHCRCSSISAL